jgi:uncharacterized membrane protein YhaH (DUF805 family)
MSLAPRAFPRPAFPDTMPGNRGDDTGRRNAMQIQEAVETCIVKKYADFEGCATRSEFWYFMLFCVLINALLAFAAEWAAGAFFLAMLVPSVAAGTRRLRDTGRGPRWWFLMVPPVIVVGWIVLVVFFSQAGQTEPTPT